MNLESIVSFIKTRIENLMIFSFKELHKKVQNLFLTLIPMVGGPKEPFFKKKNTVLDGFS
jgi:hypothetical protein